MKLAGMIFLLLSFGAAAADLQPIQKSELASVLGLVQEISGKAAENKSGYSVRVFSAPVAIGECGGSVKSCPEIRLFISVASGDLGEVPALYELPSSTGWEFAGWLPPSASRASVFMLRTTLPESNIQQKARAQWRSRSYIINATTEAASYEQQ
jgi:hypothetical protein